MPEWWKTKPVQDWTEEGQRRGARTPCLHPAESKRGQHSQSIEPLRPTKAAVLQSPMSA
jgi:hypothetical protein